MWFPDKFNYYQFVSYSCNVNDFCCFIFVVIVYSLIPFLIFMVMGFVYIAVLVVNYGISNTIVLEIP